MLVFDILANFWTEQSWTHEEYERFMEMIR